MGTLKSMMAILLGLTLTYCNASYAAWVLVDQGMIKGGGLVRDRGPVGTRVSILWSDKDGNNVSSSGEKTIGTTEFVEFYAPPLGDSGQIIADFKQFSQPSNAGEISILDVAAFEPSGTDFIVTPFADFLRISLGTNVALRIPDLYADTDGSGVLGFGDTLYSAINLFEFLSLGIPAFELGDSYTIVNGISSAFPGFLFGTEPIIRDSASPTGFRNSSPFSGVGTVVTEHNVLTVPEPSTLLLEMIGLIGLTIRQSARNHGGLYWIGKI